MRITVKFFAILRDRAGVAEAVIHVEPGRGVGAAVEQLSRDFPGVSDLLPRVAYAVNRAYVPPGTELHDGDELALIPPVSGG